MSAEGILRISGKRGAMVLKLKGTNWQRASIFILLFRAFWVSVSLRLSLIYLSLHFLFFLLLEFDLMFIFTLTVKSQR